MPRPIVIVGGGLAGLTLGLGLRKRGVPVSLFEAGRYPRHRVCGEFISGRGRAVLTELGLEKKLIDAGAREAETAAFYSGRVAGRARNLPEPALCLTRFVLDEFLADEFRRAGGELKEGHRWQEPFGEGIVRATGRRSAPGAKGWRWYGLKAHARNVQMAADLEMHLMPGGYVGLCRLGGGVFNVCGLFRSRTAVPDLAQTWRARLRGEQGSVLWERLGNADFETDTFCSVGGLWLKPQTAASHDECSIGDAITMIAPLTGNGMSMAFESAAAATSPLAAYSAGEAGWQETTREIAVNCDRLFAPRLRWSVWLQAALFQSGASDALVWCGSRWPAMWRALFARTR